MIDLISTIYSHWFKNIHFFQYIILARTEKESSSFDLSMIYLILALVGIFFLVILLYFTRTHLLPLVKLGYIILVHGRFSYDFIEFFKNNNLRNPHSNCIKDEISMHFFTFYKPKKESLFFKTDLKIEFGDTPFFATYKEIHKMKGEPGCINISRFNESRVKLVGFSESLQQLKMKSFFYFIDDHFIMGEYSFSDINKARAEDVINSVALKYLKGEKQLQVDYFYITDPAGNKLNYENNGFSVTVRYLYKGDQKTNQTLDSLFGNTDGNSESLKLTMRQEELLNRL